MLSNTDERSPQRVVELSILQHICFLAAQLVYGERPIPSQVPERVSTGTSSYQAAQPSIVRPDEGSAAVEFWDAAQAIEDPHHRTA